MISFIIVFDRPSWLFALFSIVPLMMLYVSSEFLSQRRLNRLGDPHYIRLITPARSKRRTTFKALLELFAIALIILHCAGPKFILRTLVAGPCDVALLVDVSRSMSATDVQPDRLSSVKRAIPYYLERFEKARFALVPFAGAALLTVPLTADRLTLNSFVNQLSVETIPVQGTNLAEALKMGMAALPPAGRSRFLLVFTDGEDHEKEAVETAAEARKKNYHVIFFGVGTSKGSPLFSRYRLKKDRLGNVVISKYRPEFLDSVALAAGGKSVKLTVNEAMQPSNVVSNLLEQLPKSKKEEVELSYPSIFLITGLFMLLFNFAIFERKSKKIRVLSLLFLAVNPVFGQVSLNLDRDGVKWYAEGKFTKAAEAFKKGLTGAENANRAYNLASCYYRLGRYEEALSFYRKVTISARKDSILIRKAIFNIGNSLLKLNRFQEGAAAFEQYLSTSPHDHDALYNLAYARFRLKEKRPFKQPPVQLAVYNPSPKVVPENGKQRKQKTSIGANLKVGPRSLATEVKSLKNDW